MGLRNLVGVFIFVTASVATAGSAGKSGDVDLVARLYRDFAWEAVIDEPLGVSRAFADQRRSVLERYFSPNLVSLLLEDRQCVLRTHEICKLDFSPLWASQDPGATELRVVQGALRGWVLVRFRYPSNGETIKLNYRLVKTRAGPRIADIRYDSGTTLVSILSVGKR